MVLAVSRRELCCLGPYPSTSKCSLNIYISNFLPCISQEDSKLYLLHQGNISKVEFLSTSSHTMRRERTARGRTRTRTAQAPIASQCTSSHHEHGQHECALDGPNNERRCIHIEESGKVTLQVNAWRFKVSSRQLRRTSRVWDELLQPRQCFYSDITMRLPEDLDPWALEIILRIQHQKAASLPPQLTFERLRHLAIVCDRYHVAHLITQLAVFQKWVRALEPHANESERVEWLHIAYTFGLEDIFERLAKSLVLTTMLDIHGNCLTARGRILHPDQMRLPPGIIGKFPVYIISIHRLTSASQTASPIFVIKPSNYYAKLSSIGESVFAHLAPAACVKMKIEISVMLSCLDHLKRPYHSTVLLGSTSSAFNPWLID